MTTLSALTFGEIDQEYDKYYGAITADIRRAKMIELHNKDNIKVYVDDKRYILGNVSNPRYLKITTHQNDSNYLFILLDKPIVDYNHKMKCIMYLTSNKKDYIDLQLRNLIHTDKRNVKTFRYTYTEKHTYIK